jgi:hypothetical protein
MPTSTRRDLAIASFWSTRSLVRHFIATTGRATFSLRELIAYAESLPDKIIETLQRE